MIQRKKTNHILLYFCSTCYHICLHISLAACEPNLEFLNKSITHGVSCHEFFMEFCVKNLTYPQIHRGNMGTELLKSTIIYTGAQIRGT